MRKVVCLMLALMLLPSAAAAEALPLMPYSYETGEWTHVFFGQMPTEADGTAAPVSWRVLSADAKSVLLLSDRILFSAPLDSQQNVRNGWEQSELYEYLNGEFLKTAFSWPERCVLLRQMDRALVSIPEAEDLENLRYGFAVPDARRAVGTPYAVEEGLQVFKDDRMKDSPYWTRSVKDSKEGTYRRVNKEGKWGFLGAWHKGQGVRPVIRVNLDGVTIVSGDGTAVSPYVFSLPEPSMPEPVEKTEDELEAEKLHASFLSDASAYADQFPALTEEGFLPAGQPAFSLEDSERGLWLYADQNLRIEIVRKKDAAKKKLWFEADLYVRPGSGEYLHTYWHGQDMNTRERVEPTAIARENRLVFAVNSDYYLYRVLRNARRKVMTVGVILRDGEILYDDPARKDVKILPNRDLLAIYPSGRMEVYDYNAVTAKELKTKGARDVLSFGPVLLRDGEVTDQTVRLDKTRGNEPRSGLGMVEPGHYVAIVVQGRSKESAGCKLSWFAGLFKEKGCTLAFNLDGGGTASMIFMGELLNVNAYEDHNRLQSELLGIGKTE